MSTLAAPIAVTLPYTDDAHTALRHLHEIDLNGHFVILAIPARLFKADAFIPYMKRQSTSIVDEARRLLVFTSGLAVPGQQKFHVLTMVSNHASTKLVSLASRAAHVPFVDLLCTMPLRICDATLRALVDSASNHSMITSRFLDRVGVSYEAGPSSTYGVSGTAAPCLGYVTLDTRVGRSIIPVKFTVVDDLPTAAACQHEPNEALIALDVITAVSMRIEFQQPRIIITVPAPKDAPRSKRKPWLHVIHTQSLNKHTTESSPIDDFTCSKRELKRMIAAANAGSAPLYVVHVKPVAAPAHTCLANRKGFLSTQNAPAHEAQDLSTVPECIQHVVNEHKQPGRALGPVPPHTQATGFEMDIETLPGTRPRAARQSRLTPVETAELEKQLTKLSSMGWIQPSVSPWASSVLFAPKPGGKLRLCIDYRYLNEHTIKNTYPLPRIDALLDKLRGHRFFSTLDLLSGYHQIPLSVAARPKTAFRTPEGLFEWTVMPFGLTNAPSVFQGAMHTVLHGLINKICLAYLDDIIILAHTEEEHAQNLRTVLERLEQHHFFCNIDKCHFAMTEIKYLGHVVTADTVKPDPYKVSVLESWPEQDLRDSPNNIRSFLGLAGYFRRFIPKFPTLAAPLMERVNSKTPLPWTAQCTLAFQAIKAALVNTSSLRHPDLNKPFHLYTDASDYAYGGVLMQEHDDQLMPVAWAGRKMRDAEVHYATFEKELGAIIFLARQYRCYLENNHPVFIHSDHNPLRFLQTQQKLNGKQARWVESLSRINWHITYIPGDKNVVADAVSRATHLPSNSVTLHDGYPIACVQSTRLTSLVVRRSPAEPPQPPLGVPLPSSSSLATTPLAPALHSPATSPAHYLRALLSTSRQEPSNSTAPAARRMAAVTTRSGRAPSDPRRPPPPPSRAAQRRPAAPAMPPPIPLTLAAPPATPARPQSPPPPPPPPAQEPPVPQLEDLLLDQAIQVNPGEDPAADLRQRCTDFLSLDSTMEDFWRRLQLGYAHDPAFATPPKTYRFHPKHKLYYKDHRIVVPDHDHLRKQILMWTHVHPWHAHMGTNRTIALISESFYWPNMSADVKEFVASCHSCQVMKSPSVSEAAMSPLPVPPACWRVVSLDIISQLPRSSEGYDSIVVFVDQFSKMVRLIPSTSTLSSVGFAKLFFQQIYPHYGLPLGICSDRGTQWNNVFFRDLCAHLGISLKLTFSYHPRANGQVERLNRVIEEALRHFVGPSHDDWDTYLPHIEFSINSAKSESTGCTPFQLNRITPPLSPTALAMGLPRPEQASPSTLHRLYYYLAQQALHEAKQSMWSMCEHDNLPKFSVGQNVLLSIKKIALHHPALRNKFMRRWIGPCRILELVGKSAARIELPSTLQSLRIHDVFHFSVLKPFHDSFLADSDPDPVPKPPTALQPVYEVECITDYDKAHPLDSDPFVKCPHYRVHWKGYPSSEDTWLPLAELSECLESVADYLFTVASPSRRDKLIAEFPRRARQQLAHLLARAAHTRRRAVR